MVKNIEKFCSGESKNIPEEVNMQKQYLLAPKSTPVRPEALKGAIFLDRDGTINEDIGPLFSSDKLHFIPGALNAMRLLQKKYLLFIVTNQSAIGDNLFSMKNYEDFNKYYQGQLQQQGINITYTYCCPHAKDENCSCRKPQTYFLKTVARDYGIILNRSYVIGDHPHDVEMGFKVSAKTIYLLTGHGKKHQKELLVMPDFIAADLYAAAEWITGNPSEDVFEPISEYYMREIK